MTQNLTNQKDKYGIAEDESKKHTDAIVESSSRKKVVVAGPGTGKTYLFKRIIEGKNNALTLTFVNALVEDLSLELYGMSDVKTLHSFARSTLGTATGNVKVFPKLSEVVKEDAKILLKKEIDFDFIFHNMDDGNEDIEFYKKRKNYYDKHYGYSDIIFALVKYLEANKGKVPAFDHVLVDEFQDFNKLEIALIDLLSEKSPILIAGDDDQALYEDLKSASPKHIRERFSDSCTDYKSFSLPHCRRCTRTIVEAVNDIVSNASKNGAVKERIGKRYEYFDHKEKDVESEKNPKIIYSQQFARKIPWFIEKQLGEIANEIKGKFSVLIISPTKTQCRSTVEGLKKKGFSSIEWSDKKDDKEPTLLDGLKILLDDENSNLGWRIVSRFYLTEKDFVALLTNSNSENPKRFSEMIDSSKKKEVESALKILRSVKNGKKIKEEKLDEVLRKVGFNPYDIAKENLKEEIEFGSQRVGNPGLRKTQIKATTIESSKGLAADYVFITYFDDRYFIKDKDKTKITDKDICKFLVALTRARRKVFLISSDDKKKPTFLNWINSDRIEEVS
ncbi:MAG: ATP-dependent helicase [Candidatus Blackburnbacteria bacterium]|nr:ATP-dependent helicase [Candidatus Blackburnbacteria bacterium]